ncbi:comF family protein [Lysobacter sp. yr284]|nr:comF family protein [Lysobacter sp. yr284]
MSPDTFALASPAGFWSRLGWSLWPARCLACAEPGLPGCDLCAACWAQWPRSGRSCLGCAMPLRVDSAGGNDGAGTFDSYSYSGGGGGGGGDNRSRKTAVDAIFDAGLDTGPKADRAYPDDRARPGADALHDRCNACRDDRASPLHEVRAAAFYRAPLDRLLPRFKFHRDLAAGRLLAATMAAAFASRAAELIANAATAAPRQPSAWPDDRPQARDTAGEPERRTAAAAGDTPTLVPIPLHRARLRERGYDQSLELARPLSRRLGLALSASGLHRVRATAPQSRLDAARRRRNLRDAFAWTGNAAPPTHAILIDDVMTTGATLHAAARALRRAGAQRVDAWVCARTL